MDVNWQMIVESLPHGLVVTGPRSVITVWNRTMEVVTGYISIEAVGRDSRFFQTECGIVFGPAEVPRAPPSAFPGLGNAGWNVATAAMSRC